MIKGSLIHIPSRVPEAAPIKARTLSITRSCFASKASILDLRSLHKGSITVSLAADDQSQQRRLASLACRGCRRERCRQAVRRSKGRCHLGWIGFSGGRSSRPFVLSLFGSISCDVTASSRDERGRSFQQAIMPRLRRSPNDDPKRSPLLERREGPYKLSRSEDLRNSEAKHKKRASNLQPCHPPPSRAVIVCLKPSIRPAQRCGAALSRQPNINRNQFVVRKNSSTRAYCGPSPWISRL